MSNRAGTSAYQRAMSYRRPLFFALFLILVSFAARAAESDPLLVVLTDSGRTREGLPVLIDHPQGRTIAAQLDRGAAGDLLRVYDCIQWRLHRAGGPAIEPAYLLMSDRQGGFARYGFYRGAVKKPGVPYIDVHRSWKLSGQFGAIDQIFPHELSHAIFHLLNVEPQPTDRANQVHALGVRTDRFTAFNEGFAEHFQVTAVDHPGAAPATRALASAVDDERRALRHLENYRRELGARVAIATPMRMTFPLWYSNDERTLRYFGVRRNAFAREAKIPPRLLTGGDRYAAYLLESTLPGDRDGEIKPVARMIASEGVVSALFARWAGDTAIRSRYREPAFYESYGTSAREISPLQNVYLKLFFVIERQRPRDASALIAAYKETFADEAPLVDAVTSAAFGGQAPSVPGEIWLADGDLRTGTTIFDQFRGAPRIHTFDLNAASLADLTSIRGVTPELARTIRQHAPYRSIDEVGKVSGAAPEVVSRLRQMNASLNRLGAIDEGALTLGGILRPFLWRLIAVVLVLAVAGASLYSVVVRRSGVRPSIFRMVMNGLGVAIVGIAASWSFGNGAAAIIAAVIVFGFPAAMWRLLRNRSAKGAAYAALAWFAAALPAAIATTPWF